MNMFNLVMMYDLLSYYKNLHKYKYTLNINVLVIINFKMCHFFF